MALDMDCRECQAGLAQVGQMAIGFNCMDHGRIGLEITMLMEIARVGEREKCIRDACYWCGDGRALGKNLAGDFAHADVNGLWTVTCYANAIRQRADKEGKGE